MQYSLNKDHRSITNDSSKSHGYHLQIAGLRWTSSRRSIFLYPSKNGRCSEIIENSKIGMSRHVDRPTTTQMPKSWSSMEDPVVPLERNLHGHPLAALLWEKVLLRYGWEKVSNCECLFVHREKDYSCLCMWMTSNWLERNKILIRCGKY